MKKTDMKLVLYLLQAKANANKGYRDIAKETGLSLGSVQGVMQRLADKGYLVAPDTGRTLRKRATLCEWWARGYADSGKDKMLLGRFRFLTPDVQAHWQDVVLPDGCYWGGEPAVYHLDGFITPGRWDMYVDTDLSALITTGRMVPDAGGNIFLYQKFWKGEEVPAVVIYADLLATGDDRCLEAANRLKEKL